MKRLTLVFTIMICLCAFAASEEIYPGRVLLTATSWDAEAFSPDNGFGALGGLSIEGFPWRYATATMQLGYRGAKVGSGIEPLPGASLLAGWRFPVAGLISLTPLGGTTVDIVSSNYGVEPVFNLTGALRLSLRLWARDYLTLTPSLSIPLGSPRSSRLSIAVGTRRETPWCVPVREVQPRLEANPSLFSPDADGIDDTVGLTLSAEKPKSVSRWTLSAYASGGSLWREFSGEGRMPERIEWDGKSDSGQSADAGDDFALVLRTEDPTGRAGLAETSVTVTIDILVIKEGDRYKVRVPNIHFPPDSYELSNDSSRDLLEENRAVLERIATLFTRFPEYDLTIEGYANSVSWADPEKFALEQKNELIPLSEKRVETVKQALVLLGIDSDRIKTVGLGGIRPRVEFSEKESVWKNRRVEFILSK